MTHFSNEESFGFTFAEAIARGLYLFASDVGAIRDIAQGVERVQIFGLEKWDELKTSLRHWLATEQFKQPKPAHPPFEFCQRYQPVNVARRHLEIYREILEKSGTANHQPEPVALPDRDRQAGRDQGRCL